MFGSSYKSEIVLTVRHNRVRDVWKMVQLVREGRSGSAKVAWS